MPLPQTMRLLSRLCRLTAAEARALQLLCGGRGAVEIAQILDVPDTEARALVRTGQRKARQARPWLRRPRLWEQRREVRAYWERARRLEGEGRGHELEPYEPAWRCVEEDLVADARVILQCLGNQEMRRWAPAGGPRLPGPRPIAPQELADRWIACLTGEARRSSGEAMSAVVIESLRRTHAKPR